MVLKHEFIEVIGNEWWPISTMTWLRSETRLIHHWGKRWERALTCRIRSNLSILSFPRKRLFHFYDQGSSLMLTSYPLWHYNHQSLACGKWRKDAPFWEKQIAKGVVLNLIMLFYLFIYYYCYSTTIFLLGWGFISVAH